MTLGIFSGGSLSLSLDGRGRPCGVFRAVRLKDAERLRVGERSSGMRGERNVTSPSASTSPVDADKKQSYTERKELQRKKSRLEKQVKEVETKIEKLEARIKELDAILCTPEGASDMTVVTEYTSTMKVIEKETERWEQLSMELEEIKI